MALPESRNLTIYKGDSFSFTFRLREREEDGTPGGYVDLTSVFVSSQIRANEDATTIIASFTSTIPDQTVAGNKGKVTLSLDPTVTGNAGFVGGMYDVQLTYPDSTVRTYLKGGVTVIKEVTRA